MVNFFCSGCIRCWLWNWNTEHVLCSYWQCTESTHVLIFIPYASSVTPTPLLSQVYAIEASKLAVHTQEVVKCNGLEDRVEVIHGKIEDVDLPDKVDLIISEWMGTLLLVRLP